MLFRSGAEAGAAPIAGTPAERGFAPSRTMHLPGCGGALRKIADEVSETLDYVPGRFKVVRHIREKLSCRACDTAVAAPAPDHAIARGRAGAGLWLILSSRSTTVIYRSIVSPRFSPVTG